MGSQRAAAACPRPEGGGSTLFNAALKADHPGAHPASRAQARPMAPGAPRLVGDALEVARAPSFDSHPLGGRGEGRGSRERSERGFFRPASVASGSSLCTHNSPGEPCSTPRSKTPLTGGPNL
eukprot:7314183-Prymnesium_polylepis.1